MTAFGLLVLGRELLHLCESRGQEFLDARAKAFLRVELLNVGKELLTDLVQSIFGPWLEPIDNGARNKRRELPCAIAHVIADGREANGHVQILLDATNKEIPDVLDSRGNTGGLSSGCDSVT